MKSIFSIDVEDWFHILDAPAAPDISEWNRQPSCVERNFIKLLDLLGEQNVQATCFFLGYVAERFPHLVREASERGHEVASHGYGHQLIYTMTPQAFFEDTKKSKTILENITGKPVLGYRAPGFSVTEASPWFYDKLLEAGYRYDSSVFPAPRQHGGLDSQQYSPYLTREGIMEFPITITKLMGKPFCFSGGGYLRLCPYALVRRLGRKVLAEGRPVVFYIHPREIDPRHPRLRLGFRRSFKSYVNLRTTEPKLRKIFGEFEVTTFSRFIAENPILPAEDEGWKRRPQQALDAKSVSEVA